MIKMMTGILVPSAGTLSVLGRRPHVSRMENAREMGVVFGQRSQLWWDLPLVDSFTLHQRIYDIPPARYADNLRRFGELLELTPLLDRAVRQLSLGQRMRAEIVMSLLHDPRILFLDEPTIGLDVVATRANKRRIGDCLLSSPTSATSRTRTAWNAIVLQDGWALRSTFSCLCRGQRPISPQLARATPAITARFEIVIFGEAIAIVGVICFRTAFQLNLKLSLSSADLAMKRDCCVFFPDGRVAGIVPPIADDLVPLLHQDFKVWLFG
jgi:hypothetical protein